MEEEPGFKSRPDCALAGIHLTFRPKKMITNESLAREQKNVTTNHSKLENTPTKETNRRIAVRVPSVLRVSKHSTVNKVN